MYYTFIAVWLITFLPPLYIKNEHQSSEAHLTNKVLIWWHLEINLAQISTVSRRKNNTLGQRKIYVFATVFKTTVLNENSDAVNWNGSSCFLYQMFRLNHHYSDLTAQRPTLCTYYQPCWLYVPLNHTINTLSGLTDVYLCQFLTWRRFGKEYISINSLKTSIIHKHYKVQRSYKRHLLTRQTSKLLLFYLIQSLMGCKNDWLVESINQIQIVDCLLHTNDISILVRNYIHEFTVSNKYSYTFGLILFQGYI